MISSTAKVAMPAASPERRISGSPTRSAIDAADPRCEERATACCRSSWSRRNGNRYLHDRRLLRDRHGEHAGGPGAHRDEADVAEREHAGVADEDVDRDDDRDRDERVDEVDLGRASRRCVPSSAATTTSSGGRRRAGRARGPLIRAPPARPPRANSPFGPDEQHEDDEAEDERRQVLALIGRQRAAEQTRRRTRSRSLRASRSGAGSSRRRRRRRARRSCRAARSRA